MQEILRRTGCRVHVMQDGVPDGADRVVQFFGTDSQVEVAKALVRDIIAEGPQVLNKVPSLGSPPPLVKEEVDIPPDRVGAVIGSKGKTSCSTIFSYSDVVDPSLSLFPLLICIHMQVPSLQTSCEGATARSSSTRISPRVRCTKSCTPALTARSAWPRSL